MPNPNDQPNQPIIHEVELVISYRPRTFYIVDGDPTEHKYLTRDAAKIAARLMAL